MRSEETTAHSLSAMRMERYTSTHVQGQYYSPLDYCVMTDNGKVKVNRRAVEGECTAVSHFSKRNNNDTFCFSANLFHHFVIETFNCFPQLSRVQEGCTTSEQLDGTRVRTCCCKGDMCNAPADTWMECDSSFRKDGVYGYGMKVREHPAMFIVSHCAQEPCTTACRVLTYPEYNSETKGCAKKMDECWICSACIHKVTIFLWLFMHDFDF